VITIIIKVPPHQTSLALYNLQGKWLPVKKHICGNINCGIVYDYLDGDGRHYIWPQWVVKVKSNVFANEEDI
jgi:hypothetical protein